MKSNLHFLSFLLLASSVFAQPSPQSKKITETFYPELDIEVNTPAFAKKKGFTNHEEMMAFLKVLSEKHPEKMSFKIIGQSQKGKDIPMVMLQTKSAETDKIKIWMQGGLHGNEPASTETMLYLIEQLCTNPALESKLDEIELAIVPMANIDGYEKQDRYSANGLDLNRDQTKLAAPETNFLKKAFSEFGAEVAVDFHEYKPYRKDYAMLGEFGIAGYFDAMLLYSGNLNVPQNLRDFTEKAFIEDTRAVLAKNNFSYHDYFSSGDYHGEVHLNQGSNNARSSATNVALTNTISALIEIRGVDLGRTSFKRRINCGYLIAMSFIQSAIENKRELRSQLIEATKSTHNAVVKSKKSVKEMPVKFIDIGSSSIVELTIPVHNANEMMATFTRTRPSAYLIHKDQTVVVEKLKTLGLTIEQLASSKELKVEVYTVTEFEREPEKYEGVNRQNVQTTTELKTIAFEAGTYVLYTNQARANLAIEILEPETTNSMVSFSVIETELNQTLPYYRSLAPITID